MIFYIILFLIILGIVIWGEVTSWRFISKNREGSVTKNEYYANKKIEAFKNVWSKKDKEDIIKLLKIFDKICVENDIKYFLFAGTLLGWARYKKILPWDDDVDIVIPKKDLKKFKSLSEKFKKDHGIGMVGKTWHTDNFQKLSFIKNEPIPYWKKRRIHNTFPFIDIFTYSDNQDIDAPKVINGGEVLIRAPEKIFRSEFEGVKMNIPSNWEWYLDKRFGNWRDECQTGDLIHRLEENKPNISLPCSELDINKL